MCGYYKLNSRAGVDLLRHAPVSLIRIEIIDLFSNTSMLVNKACCDMEIIVNLKDAFKVMNLSPNAGERYLSEPTSFQDRSEAMEHFHAERPKTDADAILIHTIVSEPRSEFSSKDDKTPTEDMRKYTCECLSEAFDVLEVHSNFKGLSNKQENQLIQVAESIEHFIRYGFSDQSSDELFDACEGFGMISKVLIEGTEKEKAHLFVGLDDYCSLKHPRGLTGLFEHLKEGPRLEINNKPTIDLDEEPMDLPQPKF